MKLQTVIVTSLFLVVSVFSQAQDEIWLLNGQKKKVSELEFSEDNLVVRFKNEKGKTKIISTHDLFSATPAGGQEYIYFKPTAEMSIENMKQYMEGEAAATEYKAANCFWASAFVGLQSPLLLGNAAAVLPVGFSFLLGQTKPPMSELHLASSSEFYTKGYLQVVKRKRLVRSLLGSGVGLIAGYGLHYVANK